MKIIWMIFLFALILRLVFLDISPPGFNADEAALGYNAYSLIKTGKDEWGQSFPLVFKSFSDYKPGLYVYLTIPFVAIMGLNEFSVRLPSILLGSLSIVFIYLTAKEIFKRESVALSSSILLSISPWHIHFSRGAWETNVATFLILLGVWAFIKSHITSFYLWLSSIALIASMYTYQTPRLLVPIFCLLLIIFYRKHLIIKENISIAVVSFLLLLPLVFILMSTAGLARFQGLSIFSDMGPLNRINEQRGQHQNSLNFLSKFSHNKVESYTGNFISHYLDHFNPNFLFTVGDPLKRNKVPDMGQMYIFEIVTVIFGLYYIARNKLKNSGIILIWLALAPLASSLTYQTPHAIRAHSMVIPLSLISGLGMGMLWENITTFIKSIKFIALSIALLVIGISFAFYLERYFVHQSKQFALDWENGFSQAIAYIQQNQDKYKKIVITDKYDQPYILLLFYLKYDPAKYIESTKGIGDNKFGFSTISSFDKYEFRPMAKEEVINSKDVLFVGTEEEIGEGGNLLKVINFPNSLTAFKIVGT